MPTRAGDGELIAELVAKEEEGVISEAEEEILEEIERVEEEIEDAALYEADGIEGLADGDQFQLMVDDAPQDTGNRTHYVLYTKKNNRRHTCTCTYTCMYMYISTCRMYMYIQAPNEGNQC